MMTYSKSLAIAVLFTSASFVQSGAVAGDRDDKAGFQPKYYGDCHSNVEGLGAEHASPAGTPDAQLREETRTMQETLQGVEAAQNCYSNALSDARAAGTSEASDRKMAEAQLTEIRSGTREVGKVLDKATKRYTERADALAPQVTAAVAPAAGGDSITKDPMSQSSMDLLKERDAILDKAMVAKKRQKELEKKAEKAL
ncbi:hypothetical protein [Gimibacter soli]|uniref:Uncharacterized protein n=1 Tax=Gimibacter soli TaxID=3024400 RepID=A0AAF0BMF5_9PROT|nr:hypothetical protein [Gimibacter soli]WCL54495.1 hypothetical protein PH603_01830 [Gimibacter soli]